MRIALAQMNCSDNRDANLEKAAAFIDQAAQQGAHLIVLPEFFNTFYFAIYRDYRYVALAEPDDGPTLAMVKDKARQHRAYIVATIYEEQAPGVRYDTAMLVDPQGQIVGKYRKTHPAAHRSVEKIYFRYGTRFPTFKVADWRVGFVICYDLSFPETARCATLNGAELLVVPYCAPAYYTSPDATSNRAEVLEGTADVDLWVQKWRALMVTRAVENGVYLAPCNHGGTEKDAVFSGGTMLVEPTGRIVAQVQDDEGLIVADLDRQVLWNARTSNPYLRDRHPALYTPITTEMEDLPL